MNASRNALATTCIIAIVLAGNCRVGDGAEPASPPSVWSNTAEPASDRLSLDLVLGLGGADNWDSGTGRYSIEKDQVVGNVLTIPTEAPPLALDGKTVYTGDWEIRALLRFRPKATSCAATFSFSRRITTVTDSKSNQTKPAEHMLRLVLTGIRGSGTIGDQVTAAVTQYPLPFHDVKALNAGLDWNAPHPTSFAYRLRAFPQAMPGWPEDFRARVEHDMATLPDLDHKWVSIRAELKKGLARFWLDDRLVAWKEDAQLDPAGTMRIELQPGVQLARFETRSLQPTTRNSASFLPIPLTGYLNARSLLKDASVRPDSLPPAGQIVQIDNVPFVFPGPSIDGNDHIDVGQSILRQANLPGYHSADHQPLARWPGSARRDPARIQLRLPNGQYDTLYLIAASDGEADTVPVVTAMFYRVGAGFPVCFETAIPLATARGTDMQALPVTLSNGKKANLHLVKIKLDPGQLASLSDLDIVEVELTKKVELYRSYPDPICYSYHQSGLPSSVHIYAATLGRAPVGFAWNPTTFGHVWTAPAIPTYVAILTNYTDVDQTGKLVVTARSYDGTDQITLAQQVAVKKAQKEQKTSPITLPVKLNGYYDVTATLDIAGQQWTEKRSLVRLAPDTRSTKWTAGRGALFGYWSYNGGHYTPRGDRIADLMTKAGARCGALSSPPEGSKLALAHWSPGQASSFVYGVMAQQWAAAEPLDPEKVKAYKVSVVEKLKMSREKIPAEYRPDHVYFLPEPAISSRTSHGNMLAQFADPMAILTDEEKTRLRMFYNTTRIAAEAVRESFPELKILIPWGDPTFIWPLLRSGFSTKLIDGSGLDVPLFARWPERQLDDQAIHRLYFTRKEFERAGIPNPRLQYCEGIFVPTEPGAVNWREQMDIYHRWTLISMAYGIDRFYSGWFAFDCASYYGAEHYGGCGIQRRIPYCDPKPAYAAYATMTDKLNEANFDGWIKTGSLTTYCLRFKKADNKGNIYAFWTIAGKRPVTITLSAASSIEVTDSMNNTRAIASEHRTATFVVNPSVQYVTFPVPTTEIASAQVGPADHSDTQVPAGAKLVADLGDGSWQLTNEKDAILEGNHFAIAHFPGKFSTQIRSDDRGGRALVTRLEEKAGTEHDLMPWYNVLRPARPIVLDGAPARLGLWVKGASDWGRFIYVLRDAKGERWTSIGARDEYNCDDGHSWSQFDFDGWRYCTFELPGHRGYDSFRKAGTTWWGAHGGALPGSENVVDLPLSLEAILVEQRTQVLYVNDPQPVASNEVGFGKLYVEYDRTEDQMKEAIRVSQLRMPLPNGVVELPNPIADMAKTGVGEPAQLLAVRPPEHQYDGTRAHIDFAPVEGAKAHYIWVSAHADGRGAVNMVPAGITPGQLILGLRPGIKLYYWITYSDKDGKMSKPSAGKEVVLVDMFKEK